MKYLILFFLLFTGLSSHAQIPNPFHKNVNGLAKKFKNKYPDDSTRVVAIYEWINDYMRYDLKAFKKYKFKVNSYSLNRALYRRKAMCYGLSKLFQDICLRSGIQCTQLEGYSLENPDDPYIHYYYNDHAWNTVSINGHWYLFDVTYDNGFIEKKKRPVRKFLNRTFGVPLLHDKTKYVHEPKNDFIFSTGSSFGQTHYPVLINALLISEKWSLEAFSKKKKMWGDYDPSLYPTLVQLSDYTAMNAAIKRKIAADQSLPFNPKNNLVKVSNYYQSLLNGKKVRTDFNKSDVDTVLKYAALFKRDHNALHAMNIKRVTDEHKGLSAALNKVVAQNGRMAVQYNKKTIKADAKLIKNTEVNALNASKIEERQLKLEEQESSTRKKYDSIPFQQHLTQYNTTLAAGDSLWVSLTKNNPVLDSMNTQAEKLFLTLYEALQRRKVLLMTHRNADADLKPYPKLKIITEAIDSMNRLTEYCKVQMEKTESAYNKIRQQSIRMATIGFTLTSKEYLRIKTGVLVEPPYSKDTLVEELKKRSEAFKNGLVNLYHHDEELLHNHTAQFRMLASILKSEKKVLKNTIRMRAMAYEHRLKHENYRYRAYDKLITDISSHMRNLKMTYKKKTASRK